jgi:hypothetical protein
LYTCATSRTAAGMRQSPKNAVAMRRPPNALPRWPSRYANVPDLVVALVDTTALSRLVLQTMPHPPTHTKCWGGFIRQLRPCWRERPHFVARWCHQLRPPRWHHLCTPFLLPLLFLVTWYVLHQGEGPPIHSERSLHNGSACGASHVLVVYAGVMALVLPIKWSLFFAGDVIGLALPTKPLVMDGITRGGRGDFVSCSTRLTLLQFFRFSEDCFSWLKFTSFCLPFFFYLFWLIMVHHPSFASFALFPSGLSLCFCFFSPLNRIYDSIKCEGGLTDTV